MNPYPHKFHRTLRIDELRAKFDSLVTENGVFLEESKDEISITGRVMNIRESSAKLVFIDLEGDQQKVQLFCNAANYTGDFNVLRESIKRGDIIGAKGFPGRTKTGELSVRPVIIEQLSYCLHMLPQRDGEKNVLNKDTRYRQRYLDLIMNNPVKKIFQRRNQVIDFVRQFLRQRDFTEVETPMMNMIPGGATARPFETFHNDLNMKLYMRIAPELYLKELIVGGIDRVFEIGKQFRNESIDMTHNPEFTTCELYEAYADYHDLMEMTEKMLSEMVKTMNNGSYVLKYHPNDDPANPDKVYDIDFTPPFRRIPMMKGLEEVLKV